VTPEELVRGAIVVAIFLLIAFPVHEFSHAWAAYRLGDSTARYQGRLTLNPIAHFDPLGGTMLAISILFLGFGFGWAKPTPVNPYNLRYGRRGEAIVALAGPLSNLVMAIAVAIPLRIIQADAGLSAAVAGNGIASFTFDVGVTFVVVAVLLLVFNLLPIPPLDGSAVLSLGFAPETARRYQGFLRSTPMLGWIGMFAAWHLFDVLFDPIFTAAASLLYPGVTYG